MPADDRRSSRKLTPTEIAAMAGGALLALALFLPWFHAENQNAIFNDAPVPRTGEDFSGFDSFTITRWLLLLAAIAPFILAYIIVRGHQLSWARGELTAVTSIAALGLIVYNGVIDKPGEPSGLISIKWGWFLALLGVILMLVGSALRASEVERARKPPGVL